MSGGPHGNINKRLLSKSRICSGADRVRLATAELVTVPELMVNAWMSSMTTSQYQNRLGTARERLLVGHFAYLKMLL